ncbi:MAG TPA: hypothetical protein ENI45_02435 [Thermoplasmatales archaeon]|nr:hypothetical protein [Thermoplasmatales archaeon]
MVGMRKNKSAEDTDNVEEKKLTNEQMQDEVKQEENTNTQTNDSADVKQDKDSIRRIIKLGPDKNTEEAAEEEKKNKEETVETDEQQPKEKSSPAAVDEPKKDVAETSSPGELLDQQRAVLQNIKDFDFQIKKNQEEIKNLSEKVESISKDLDDLVSLYEIVSEQMNPFVGLSKVTKQRLEALENFTTEIQTLKERIEELELSIGKTPSQQVEETVTENSSVSPSISTDMDKVVEKALDAVTYEEEIDEVIESFLKELK